MSTEIQAVTPQFSNDDLREIDSFESALNLLGATLGAESIDDASEELGNGFELIEDKKQLVGTTMVLLSWRFPESDKGAEGYFAAVQAVTKDGRKVIFNDGSSTGIYRQLRDYSARTGKYAGLVVRRGLRESTYPYTDSNGRTSQATTYYLDTAK